MFRYTKGLMMLTAAKRKVLKIELEQKIHNSSEIARQLGISPQRVGVIRRSPDYKRALLSKEDIALAKKNLSRIERIKEEVIYDEVKKSLDPVIKVFKDNALPAAIRIAELSQSAKEEALQFASSKEVLNQAGYVPEKKVTTMSVELTGPDAERISRAFSISQTRTRDVGPDN